MKDIELINKYTQREMSDEEVFVFSLTLCDNDIDRDLEAFDDETLEELSRLFVGRTGIFNHSASASDQSARVFSARIEDGGERLNAMGRSYKRLAAKAYMVRTDENASLIKEIEGGIKREVSINCSVKEKRCSICGKSVCGHVRGKEYKGKLCYTILSGATDAYEWSFVAIPAQRNAGVSKGFDPSVLKTRTTAPDESVLIKKAELDGLLGELESLRGDAAFGERYKKRLILELRRCLAAKSSAGGSAVEAVRFAEALSPEELERFIGSFSVLFDSDGASPQLSPPKGSPGVDCYH